MLKTRSLLSGARKKSDDLTTAPSRTTFPAVWREPCGLSLCALGGSHKSGLTSTFTRTVIIDPAAAPPVIPTDDTSTTATTSASTTPTH